MASPVAGVVSQRIAGIDPTINVLKTWMAA